MYLWTYWILYKAPLWDVVDLKSRGCCKLNLGVAESSSVIAIYSEY